MMITKRGPRGPYNVEHKSKNLNIRVTDKMHNAIQRAAKRTRQPCRISPLRTSRFPEFRTTR